MDFSWVFSIGLKLALELRDFLNKYGDIQRGKKQFFNAISDNIDKFDENWERLFQYNEDVVNLLDEIGISPNADQVYRFLELSADSFRIYSEFTNAYVNYSINVREFSVNKDMMENLRKYKGTLYDYVQRISETVTENNKIVIDGRLITFFKANKDEFMIVLDDSESEKVMEEAERIINDIKRKILPSLINQKPRFVFRRKRIQSLFKEPIHRFLIDKDKIIFDVPEQETINFVASTNIPIFYLMDELSAIENRATNRRLEHMR